MSRLLNLFSSSAGSPDQIQFEVLEEDNVILDSDSDSDDIENIKKPKKFFKKRVIKKEKPKKPKKPKKFFEEDQKKKISKILEKENQGRHRIQRVKTINKSLILSWNLTEEDINEINKVNDIQDL